LQIAKRKDKLLNYMLFLRITPTLPNTFINMASPIVDIPFHIFFAATLVGLIPASYITVKVSINTCNVYHLSIGLELSIISTEFHVVCKTVSLHVLFLDILAFLFS
jgi:uncharacterized membrane protein YdjX (TVP38/TMEM64 family)